jgi:hypothetical protein
MVNIHTPAIIHIKEEIESRSEEIYQEYNESVYGFNVFTYIANKGKYDTKEWTYVRKDGTQFPIQLTVTAIKRNGITTGYLGTSILAV